MYAGASATALLERLIVEGTRQLDHPGIIFRGPEHDRRAALAARPDVWEVVSRLSEPDGSEEHRIAVLADVTDLHPRVHLPAGGGAQSAALATVLDRWARANPEPYIGQHWLR